MSQNKDNSKAWYYLWMYLTEQHFLFPLQPNEQLFENKFTFLNEYRQQPWANTK